MIKKGCVFSVVLLLAACGGGSGSKAPASYKATAMAGAGGSVAPAFASVTVGSTASFVVTPAEGYSLKAVDGCGGNLQGANFVTGPLSGNCTISAEFSRNAYQVGVTTGSGGSAPVTGSAVLHGDTLSLALAPDVGYQVESVSGCGAGSLSGNTYVSAPIKAACQLDVRFAKKRVAVSGLVAIGKPLANARVSARCLGGSGFAGPVMTNSKGEFAADVPELDLPCAVRAETENGLMTYQSLVVKPGRVNITLFTDMVLTLALERWPGVWHEFGSVPEVLPLLPAAQTKLLAIFESSGYKLPSSEFKPFDGNLVIGDEWDVLLDQFGTGLAQTANSDYGSLLYNLIAGEVHRFPLPNGDKELTAEACFNPVLYQPGTNLTIKRHTIDIAGAAVSHNLHEIYFDNRELVEQGGSQQLSQWYEVTSCFSSDPKLTNPSCWTGVGRAQRLVDLNMKTVGELSIEYEQDPIRNSFNPVLRDAIYSEKHSTLGNQIRYRFPADVEFKETFDFTKDFKFSTIYLPATNVSYMSSAKITKARKFVGIKTLSRGGKSYEVCEFSVAERKSVSVGSTDPANPSGDSSSSYAQYFLVGAGVEVTDAAITSIAINGAEVYSNPAFNP